MMYLLLLVQISQRFTMEALRLHPHIREGAFRRGFTKARPVSPL